MTQITLDGPASPSTHPLVSRLTRLRGRVRIILGLHGLGVLLAAGVGAMFVLMLADYLLHFDLDALRMVLLIAWVVGAALLAWRFLVTPLSTRLTDQFLASRVENLHRDLSDELMSAVHFIHAGAAASNALAARHIDSAAHKTAAIRFEEAVDFRQAGKSLGLAALTVIVVALVGGLNPGLARIAMARWFSASPLAWPMTTHVAFDWSDYGGAPPKVLPLGEKVIVRARVDRGSPRWVALYQWSDKRQLPDQLMTLQEKQSTSSLRVYEAALEPEGATLSLRVAAGDDRDEPAVQIALAARPVVQELFASIAPPPYVKNLKDPSQPAPPVVVDLLAQAARAVEHATISLRVKASKPFRTDSSGQPLVRLLDQNKDEEIPLAMTRKLVESHVAQLTFPAARTLQARLVVTDADGFENRVGGGLTIEVVPDALPSIVITEPRRSVERSPEAIVELAMQGTDDQGLDGLKLAAWKFDAKPEEAPAFESPIPWADRTVDAAIGSTAGKAAYTWDLKPLNLQPGARVLFYGMVQDNYDWDGRRHDWVKSAPLSLLIRTQAEIIETGRKDLNEIKERIKNLRNQQETSRSFTEAIRKAIEASNVTTSQQKSQFADLAAQQGQEAASASAIEQRAAQVADNLRQNQLAEHELGKLAREVAAGMQQVGQENMPRAAADLGKAQQSAGNQSPDRQNTPQARQEAQQTASAAASANTQQEQAITRMDQMLDRLASAGDFEAARQAVAKILQQQKELNKQTNDVASKVAGDPNPPKPVRDEEQRLANHQNDLKDQTLQAIEQIEKSAQALSESDPSSSQSLQRAAEAGKQNDVPGNQAAANQSLSQNQPNNASGQQAQATAGLQQMMDELNKNERRQLEQLARQLADLLKQVQELRAAEDTLNKDTVAAGASAATQAMQKLGDRQGTLHQNTIVVQKRAESTRQAQTTAVDIREAADDMGVAAGALYGSKQPDSLDPETKAIAALDRAIEKLKKAADMVNSQLKDKDLAEYIKKYEAIKTDQVTVQKKTHDVDARRLAAEDRQIDRKGELQLAGLATDQDGLIGRIKELSDDDKLKAFDVVVWMNGQVTETMTISKDRLGRAQLGTQLASAQQTSIDRIDMIIDALKDEQRRESDFRSNGGGGGGGQRPLVPPLAQLKLLKAMQVVINGQTTSASNSIDAAQSEDEKSEYRGQVEQLGKKQGEIKGIADKLLQQLTR